MLLKAGLFTFPFFLLNGKVAYYVDDGNGQYLIRNNGSRAELDAASFEVGGSGLRYYVFDAEGERLCSFPFLQSEIPDMGTADKAVHRTP